MDDTTRSAISVATPGGGSSSGAVVSGSTITNAPAVDSGTADEGASAAGGASPAKKDDTVLVVPEETKKQFPDLVELIVKSESMNNSERNYWLQVLPVMTEAQVAELRDILETEKRKLAEIDKKYEQSEPKNIDVEAVEKERREAAANREKEEEEARKSEDPDAILGQLQAV